MIPPSLLTTGSVTASNSALIQILHYLLRNFVWTCFLVYSPVGFLHGLVETQWKNINQSSTRSIQNNFFLQRLLNTTQICLTKKIRLQFAWKIRTYHEWMYHADERKLVDFAIPTVFLTHGRGMVWVPFVTLYGREICEVQSCKLCNKECMIPSTQIKNSEIFAFIAF